MRRPDPRGFTLIEVILSASIFALVSVITWGALNSTFKTERAVSQRTELQETGTAILNKIREDLSQAFLVQSPRIFTFFKGEDNVEQDRVTFSALAHAPSRIDGRESEQTQVTYWTESNPAEPQLFLLKRKETPYLDTAEEVEAEGVTIAANLLSFNLEYSPDGVTYAPIWDSKSAEQMNKLPKILRLGLKMRDARGREEFFETIVDLPMSEGINVQAAAAPSSQGGATGTPTPRPSPPPGRGPRPPSRGGGVPN